MRLYKIFLLLFLFVAIPTIAATNDIVFSEDITVSDVTLGSDTTDMTVFASSSAESFDLSSGVFTITNPGSSFNVGSTNASVGTIVILKSGAMESCTANTVPGASSTTLPTASGVYTIRPLETTSCSSLCSSLTGAATYNAYPTCGAATCNSGYTLSGSGSSATCSVQSPSGGGGGSYIPPSTTTQDDNITTTQSFVTSSDGTKITSEIKTTKNDSGVVEKIEVDAVITTSAEIKDAQTIKLDSSEKAEVKEVKIEIKKELIEEIVGTSTSKEINVNIKSGDATTVQKNIIARGSKFLVGYDVFSIVISVGDNKIDKFVNPINLTFDISGITDRNNLKIYYYNETTNKWEIAGDGGQVVGNNIVVEIDHLTDFGIMRDEEEVEEEVEENKDQLSDRGMQMLHIEDDANVIFISGTDLNTILIHNNVEKDTEKQSYGMSNYIPELKEGVADLTINNIYAINNFIIYGTITTRKLGAGERAGVVNSYKKAFNKLPTTQAEWKDCVAIGNGRWPGETSESAELKAHEEFKTIYLRDSNIENPNDNAAVTVIAYGLRPVNRNMDSEKAGINIFKGIYKHNPTSTLDWDIVRAISYSGATR